MNTHHADRCVFSLSREEHPRKFPYHFVLFGRNFIWNHDVTIVVNRHDRTKTFLIVPNVTTLKDMKQETEMKVWFRRKVVMSETKLVKVLKNGSGENTHLSSEHACVVGRPISSPLPRPFIIARRFHEVPSPPRL